MKKILFLLLISIASYGQADFPEGINLGGNTATAESSKIVSQQPGTGELNYINATALPVSTAVQGSLDTKENVANKSDSYTTSSSTAYVSGKALVEGLGTKQNTLTNPVTGTFVAGRVPYSSSNSTLTDSSKLLWNNTNSYFEVNGNAPRFTLKNNLNNFSTYFTNNVNGILFLKNHQDKTLAAFNNPVWSTDQPQMSIGNVSSIPTESQLYVYGGKNGANIDARGSATVDECNIDLEGNDWTTSPNSLGFSYFGSNATSFGTMLGYPKNKLGIIRFQETNYAIINSEKEAGVSPIRFGINNIEIGNVNDKGFSYQSDFSSENISNPRWLADKGYVDTKAPLSGSTNYIQNQNASAQAANIWISGSIKAGAATFASTVTAPTFIGSLSGNASSASNATAFGGFPYGGVYSSGTLYYSTLFNSTSNEFQLADQSATRTFLGLGSNAYSSTAYLPLSGGTLSGIVTAPTAPVGTNTTQIATTAFVQTEISNNTVSRVIAPDVVIANGATAVIITLASNASYLGHITYLSNKTRFKSIILGVGQEGGSVQGAINVINDPAGSQFSVSIVGGVVSVTNTSGASQTFKIVLSKIGF